MPRVVIGEVEIYYERHGAGLTVVLAAGLGGWGSYWRAQVEDLARDHTVVIYDHRGVGRSAPAEPPFSVSGLARDVVGLMDALDIDQAAYVGHSTGGAMGQWLAVNHGHRFTAMVLSATWRRADARFQALIEARKETLLALGPAGYVRHSLPWVYPRDWFVANAEDLPARIAEMAAALPPDHVLAGRLDALLASDHGDGLEAIGLPVLVAYASDDCLIPPACSLEVARAVRGAARCRFATGGHHFPQTRTRRFNRAIRDFLENASRRTP